MERVGERTYVESGSTSITFRIRKQIGSVVISILCGVFLYYVFNTKWVLVSIGIYALIEYFGFSDIIFDKKSGLIRKRYGIGSFLLGDSYRFSLSNSQIKASATLSNFDTPVHDLYVIKITDGKRSMVLYDTTNLELIEEMFARLQIAGVKTLTWEVEQTETS